MNYCLYIYHQLVFDTLMGLFHTLKIKSNESYDT